MRIPSALKWLAVAMACWTIWRVPPTVADYRAFYAKGPSTAIQADKPILKAPPHMADGEPRPTTQLTQKAGPPHGLHAHKLENLDLETPRLSVAQLSETSHLKKTPHTAPLLEDYAARAVTQRPQPTNTAIVGKSAPTKQNGAAVYTLTHPPASAHSQTHPSLSTLSAQTTLETHGLSKPTALLHDARLTSASIQNPCAPSVALATVPSATLPQQNANGPHSNAGAIAQQGYAYLAAHEKYQAVQCLKAALALDPTDPRATHWSADYDRLTKRFSGYAYAMLRANNSQGFHQTPALKPLPGLAGSQAALQLGFRPNPLAKRPLTLAARVFTPLDSGSGRTKASQAVTGIEWQAIPNVPITGAVERYVALGPDSRDAWAVRLTGSLSETMHNVHVPIIGPTLPELSITAYMQAGVIGRNATDAFVDTQAFVTTPLPFFMHRETKTTAGIGIWGAAQPGASRLDVGPAITIDVPLSDYQLSLRADWRSRIAGNARPSHGPSITLSTGF